MNRVEEAERCDREVIVALKDREDDDPLLSCSLYHLGVLLQRHFKPERWLEAEHCFKRVLPVFRAKIEEHHERLVVIIQALVEIYHSQDRQGGAENLLTDHLTVIEAMYGNDSLQFASALVEIAFFYEDLANWREASHFMTRALYIREQNLGADHWRCIVPLRSLAGCAEMQDHLEEAVELWTRALNGLEREYGSSDDETKEAARKVLNLLNELGKHDEEMGLVERLRDLGVVFRKRASTGVDLAASIDNQEAGQRDGTSNDSTHNPGSSLSESAIVASRASPNRQNKL